MRKSIYLLTTARSSHTHLLLTTPTSHTHTFHPLSTIVIHTLNLCKVKSMDDNCGEWVECMGVVSRRWVWLVGGWNLWAWLLGVVVRRYIDFLILLIPTPLVSVLFYSRIPTFCSFKKMFFVLYIYLCRHAWSDLKHRHALYHSKIPAASAISTSYECYIRNQFKPFFRAIKPEILRHSP